MLLNLTPFLVNIPILYPLKTPENQRFSGVSRGYKMGILARNGLRTLNLRYIITLLTTNLQFKTSKIFSELKPYKRIHNPVQHLRFQSLTIFAKSSILDV